MTYTKSKILALILLTTFASASVSVPRAQAGEMTVPLMPKAGAMVQLSQAFTPAQLKGIVVHPNQPLQFDFLIGQGDGQLSTEEKSQEYNTLIKYFLASLAVADKDQWVNLSPYEHNRIIEENFGKTIMGRDLLAQDYLLKQIMSSLMYPESGLGKTFWDKVYEKAGNANVPINAFNKVWIMPDQAVIHENGNTAVIVKSHLKVMLEEDYLAKAKNTTDTMPSATKEMMRNILLPELEREVNEGKNFASLRQVFSGMILATWYKRALKDSLLGQVYADKAKVKGIDQPACRQAGTKCDANEEIYQEYLQAFKKGVFNYIKEDQQSIPRKYFAGGITGLGNLSLDTKQVNRAMISADVAGTEAVTTQFDAAMDVDPIAKKLIIFNESIPSFDIKDPKLKYLTWLMAEDIEKDNGWQRTYHAMDNQTLSQEFQSFIDSGVFQEPFLSSKNMSPEGIIAFLDALSRRYGAVELDVKDLTEDFIGNSLWLGLEGFAAASVRKDKDLHESMVKAKAWVREVFIRAGLNDAAMTPEQYVQDFRRFLDRMGSLREEEKVHAVNLLKMISHLHDPRYRFENSIEYAADLNFYILRIRAEKNLKVLQAIGAYFTAEKRSIFVPAIFEAIHDKITKLSKPEATIDFDEGVLKLAKLHLPDSLGYQRVELLANERVIVNLQDVAEQRDGVLFNINSVFRHKPFTIEIMKRKSTNALGYDLVFVGTYDGRTSDFIIQNNTRKGVVPIPYRSILKGNMFVLGLDVFGKQFDFSNVIVESVKPSELSSIYVLYKPKPKYLPLSKSALPYDQAMATVAQSDVGGIDLNSGNLDLQIKRDGNGVVMPLVEQDLVQLSRIEGLVPRIIAIKPASSLPELQ